MDTTRLVTPLGRKQGMLLPQLTWLFHTERKQINQSRYIAPNLVYLCNETQLGEKSLQKQEDGDGYL